MKPIDEVVGVKVITTREYNFEVFIEKRIKYNCSPKCFNL